MGDRDEALFCELAGEPLAPIKVVPNGVGDTACAAELSGLGVAVGGTAVGFGVGRCEGVGRGVPVGGGVGAFVGEGVGVGAVTTTGLTETGDGLAPLATTALNVTVQLPTGSVVEPVHVP